MASRQLDDLDPRLRQIAVEFLTKCTEAGIDVLVTCTWRSDDEQAELYAEGRTKEGTRCRCNGGRPNAPGVCTYHPMGLVKTKAKPGESKHNRMVAGRRAALAFDVVPLRGGKAIWGTRGDDLRIWLQVGAIGEALGLVWYGNPSSKFREFPHFQLAT